MQAAEVFDRFRKAGALLEGHFILSSGLHSSSYLQSALVLQYPKEAELLGKALAAEFVDQKIELVAAPALGGIIIGHEVARALGARFVWTERQQGRMMLRRGFQVAVDELTLVVEDVITTGGSTRETIETLQAAGAQVLAAASIIDRSMGRADVGVPRKALATLDVPALEPAVCDLCRQGVPLVKPGSRV
ncbi:MAG TPA: orotate phosphoribosyltransferase [Pyrinomonadaceae bacterium]|nr:orotate phosphoribosyltransferase [Pyrinomonadaceae bacterium]